jgi:integrase/recombinase XerC
MSPQTDKIQPMALSSATLQDGYVDFILSREAMLCAENTIKYYRATCEKFIRWLEAQGISWTSELTVHHIREYLALLARSGKSDRTVFDYAGAIRAMIRFLHAEGYLPTPLTFKMPKVAKKRQPTLDAQQLSKVIRSCDNPRDKALVMLMADSGLRRSEVIALNWADLDFQSGLLKVAKAKGGKFRTAVVGATARRQLLKYRRILDDHSDTAPMFQTRTHGRFTAKGFAQVFVKLSQRSGLHVTPHAMRRCFTILSLRAGMDILHLQRLGGWNSLELVKHYAQMEEIDLLKAHKAHGPIDNLD